MTRAVEIVEVGPRDGLQSVKAIVPTADKIDLIDHLYRAGVRRMECTSFVSAGAVPQMADAAEIVAATNTLEGLVAQVLVPTARYAERALAAGATYLSAFISASEQHNQANIRRSHRESVEDYRQMVGLMAEDTQMRLNIVTAFDCPFSGPVSPDAVFSLLEPLLAITEKAEVALCDTTGRAHPHQVSTLFSAAQARFPNVKNWAFHGHDTYGMGAANVMAAWNAGVSTIDASVAGLGGCPFAPGATGNVATEDLVWMFDQMEVDSGINLGALLNVAENVVAIPTAQTGGRVRDALAARRLLQDCA